MFPAEEYERYVLGTGELLLPVLRIARGIAHHLQAHRLEIGTRELEPSARAEPS